MSERDAEPFFGNGGINLSRGNASQGMRDMGHAAHVLDPVLLGFIEAVFTQQANKLPVRGGNDLCGDLLADEPEAVTMGAAFATDMDIVDFPVSVDRFQAIPEIGR